MTEEGYSQIENKERMPGSVTVVTTTFYHKYGDKSEGTRGKVDTLRGDLALAMLQEAIDNNCQALVVDGGSPDLFIDKLKESGVITEIETEHGMSGSRRQAMRRGNKLERTKVIAWVEPEKVSFAKDCLTTAADPILDGRADIVIPKRDEEAWATYPPYQVDFEKRANKLWNQILREQGILPEEAEDLDVWFGPRLFKNDKRILELFTAKYEFIKRNIKLDKIVDPELWPNATFLPIIAAIIKGYRVVSVEVPYRHPTEQTAIEKDSQEFRRKRDVQLKNIITSTIHYIRLLQQNHKSRLHQT